MFLLYKAHSLFILSKILKFKKTCYHKLRNSQLLIIFCKVLIFKLIKGLAGTFGLLCILELPSEKFGLKVLSAGVMILLLFDDEGSREGSMTDWPRRKPEGLAVGWVRGRKMPVLELKPIGGFWW